MQFVDSEPSVFRANISQYFGNMLKNPDLGKNVEISIFNYTIQESSFRQIIKKWKNLKFAEIYDGRLRTMITNLKRNPDLIEQIKQKTLPPKTLATMTHQEMAPEHWRQRIELKMKRDKSKLSTNIEASTDLFQCKKCRSKKCTYYELQTRSADEPATIFITCLDCGKNWKN